MIRLALRFDDPSATSNQALEEDIFAAARAAGIPLTVAVIPFRNQRGEQVRLTEARAAHLIQAERDSIIEVAQHGYCHEPETAGQKPPSEFSGLDFNSQLEKIRQGRSALEALFGKTITGFVPPWNTFDARTSSALAQSGFRYLSAGWELDVDCSSSLAYLPRTCQMTKLQAALEALRPFDSLDPVVVAVMHHYDFAESGNPQATTDLNRFGTLLQSLGRDARLQVSTLSGLADAACASLQNRVRQNAWGSLHWQLQRRLPSRALLRQAWPRLIIHSLLHSS
jgi:hypothetical protein